MKNLLSNVSLAIFLALLAVFGLVTTFGVILPNLFSAKSYEAVGLGILLLAVVVFMSVRFAVLAIKGLLEVTRR